MLRDPKLWLRSVGGLSLCVVWLTLPQVVRAEGNGQKTIAPLPERVATLIEQLGHDNFAARERAQAELNRLGLVAFDALLDAQDHDNVEVALRARYLIRGMRINWVREDDPPDVKSALRGYEKLNETERRSRMDRLASLDGGQGLEALCRLVRFETDERLSKRAALLVIRQEPPPQSVPRQDVARRIKLAAGQSGRIGAQWLRCYGDTLDNPAVAVAQWDRLTRAEQEAFSYTPEKSSPEIIGSLLLWQADMLRDLGRNDEAIAVILRRLSLLEDRRKDVIETVDWLIERQAWSMVDDVAQRFLGQFENDPEFLYRLAEARLKQNKHPLAEEMAARAFALNPQDIPEHKRVGFELQARGLLDWAEREYRFVMDNGAASIGAHVEAHLLLCEMLHDALKDEEAGKVLKALVDLAEKDQNVASTVQQRRGELESVKSRMHFFFAQHHAAQGESQKVRADLESAIAFDPTDADVLIAMYRVDGQDDPWRERTMALINDAAADFRRQIEQVQAVLSQADLARDQERKHNIELYLASLCNQLAWLVGNTAGDYDEALRASHLSLELRPDTAGYLDTLGRCYYSKKDYANAVKYQQLAVRGDPYSGQIRRQLELFEKALAESKKKPTTP